MAKTKQLFCQQPDRDVPKIKCGYPLPCPHHTTLVIISKKAKQNKK